MMKNLTSFLSEAEQQQPKRVADDVVESFGRYNPIHAGHGKALNFASKLAEGIGNDRQADVKFNASKTNDPKKNPFPFAAKMYYAKKMFPEHAQKWDMDPNNKTILNSATKAHQEGYKNFHFVGGEDRVKGMEDLLRRYNGQLYDFKNIYSHNAGKRDSQSQDMLEAMSASKMRKMALSDDFDGFKKGLVFNKSFTMTDAKKMFEQLQEFQRGQLYESWESDTKAYQEQLSEAYRRGYIYEEGDVVEQLSSGLVGEITRRGTNHIICVTEDDIMFKSFIHDVHLI